jgi:hypothetical protein
MDGSLRDFKIGVKAASHGTRLPGWWARTRPDPGVYFRSSFSLEVQGEV